MACVPCQVILWDERLTSMLNGVTSLAQIKLQGGHSPVTPDWGRRWYELVESTCDQMEVLLEEVTGTSGSSAAE